MSQCHVCGFIIIIARKEGGAWERTSQAVDIRARAGERRRMDAEVDGAGPSVMVVEKDVVRPSAMVVESDSVGPSPMVTEARATTTPFT